MHLTGALKVAEGPWHWGELSLDYALCKDGKHQSPARQEYSEPLAQLKALCAHNVRPVQPLDGRRILAGE